MEIHGNPSFDTSNMEIHGNNKTAVVVDGGRIIIYSAHISPIQQIASIISTGGGFGSYTFPMPVRLATILHDVGIEVSASGCKAVRCGFCPEVHKQYSLHEPQLQHLSMNPMSGVRIIDDSKHLEFRNPEALREILTRIMNEWQRNRDTRI